MGAEPEREFEWPRWELSGQLSLTAAADSVSFRVQGIAGRLLGRHEIELRFAGSRVLEATTIDLDGGYAIHARWRSLLPFVRVAAGVRIEHVGGGLARTRAILGGGAGVKVLLHRVVGIRLDLEYRHLTGAPGVSDELGLLVGVMALW